MTSNNLNARDDLSRLRLTTISTLRLIDQFSTSLSSSPTTTPPADAPNPLDVLHTTATLLKAQATKLSLLVITAPFTPTAVTTILRDVSTNCLPALMSAIEICPPKKYSEVLHKEVQARVRRLLSEFASLVREIPDEEVNGNGNAKRDSLASTGVVWEACDALTSLRDEGIVGMVVKKAEDWRAMIKDALAELKEWSQHDTGSDDGGAEDGDMDSFDRAAEGDEAFENIFGASSSLPRGPSALRSQLDLSLSKLSLIQVLYQAIIKRRLKTLPLLSNSLSASTSSSHFHTISTLDQVMIYLQSIPSQTDELASAYYELNSNDVREQHNEILNEAKKVASLMRLNWIGEEDQFTEWSMKWATLIDKSQ